MFEVRESERCGLGVFATQAIPPGTLIIREKPFLGKHFYFYAKYLNRSGESKVSWLDH